MVVVYSGFHAALAGQDHFFGPSNVNSDPGLVSKSNPREIRIDGGGGSDPFLSSACVLNAL